ncbi:MAG: S9 family peptidase [bacterium]|nr:S9 family peptidase [bacterium]
MSSLRYKKSTSSYLLIIAFIIALAATLTAQESPQPPMATKIPKADTTLGDVRIDDYFWLRDKSDPDVMDYLDAENDYTVAMMKDTEALQEKLYNELVGRIKETDLSVPERIDDYYYYSRTEQGKDYPIYCRKKGSLDGAEEILLDQNVLAAGIGYFDVGGFSVSPNHELLAYTVDTTGSEVYELHVKNLVTGELLPDRIQNVGTSIAWASDNATFFYDVIDETYRPYRVYRHVLGTESTADVLVFEELDEHFFLDVTRTRDKQWILISLGSKTSAEAWFISAATPLAEFKVVEPRTGELEYYVYPHGDTFFILTNDNAVNFKIVEAPSANPARSNWKEFIPYDDKIKIDAIYSFANHLVIQQRQNGLQEMKVVNLKDKTAHNVEFPEQTYSIAGDANPEFNISLLRFSYQSMTTPKTVYDYDMEKRTRVALKTTEVLGGFDPANYQSERVLATAPDGVQVPVAVVYRKDKFKKDGTNPLYLYGYGAYGDPLDPWFSSNRISLLDRGMVFAIAQTRGGGEMGRQWYLDGKLLKKKNTFTDFIACAEHLIAEKYCAKDKVVANGASAGGLLIGAITNMRPDLWKATIGDVPFVDLINTMLDPTIPLTVTEWEEWGNPAEADYYPYMKSYSPYDNVVAKDYPHILITTSLNDPRVAYWEPAKWCAKLRANKTDSNLLLFKIDLDAGHGGASGRYQQFREIAFEYAFVLKVLGITD